MEKGYACAWSISEANFHKARLTHSDRPDNHSTLLSTTQIGGEEKELPRGVEGAAGINGSDQF